jgi:hypothetical protein
VIAGEKHFTLIPPTDYPYLYEDEYQAATYVEKNGKFHYFSLLFFFFSFLVIYL